MILYLPAAIVTVLLPKVSARATRGEASGDILAASVGVTLAASALLTLAYAVVPGTVVHLAFGRRSTTPPSLLDLFGIAMSGYALLNVLLIYHLARNATAMSWLLLAGAVLQLGGYMLLHDSPRQLLAVSIATMVALVVAHEVFVERSLTICSRQARSPLMQRTATRLLDRFGGLPAGDGPLAVAARRAPRLERLRRAVGRYFRHARLLGGRARRRITVHVRARPADERARGHGERRPRSRSRTRIQPAFVWAARGVVGIVAALNLFMLAGFALAGLAMFALLDRLRLHPAASLFGAYVYAFNPYMFSKLRGGSRRPDPHMDLPGDRRAAARAAASAGRIRTAALLGGAVAVAFYLHTYYGFFALVLGAVFTAVGSSVARTGAGTLGLAAASVTTATVALRAGARSGDPRSRRRRPSRTRRGGATGPRSRVLALSRPRRAEPAPRWPRRRRDRASLDRVSEPTLFFGYSTMLLALAGFVLLVRRHPHFSEPIAPVPRHRGRGARAGRVRDVPAPHVSRRARCRRT